MEIRPELILLISEGGPIDSKETLKARLEALSDEELASVFVPDVYQKDIYDIDYGRLKEKNIKLISFDADDTIGDTMLDKLAARACPCCSLPCLTKPGGW